MRATILLGAFLLLLSGCSGPEVRDFDPRTAGISQLQQPKAPVGYWLEYREDGNLLQREDATEQGQRLSTVRDALRTSIKYILARPTDYTEATFASPKENLLVTLRVELERSFASNKLRVQLLTRTAAQREWTAMEVLLHPEVIERGPLRTAVISAFDSHGLAIALHRWVGNEGRVELGEDGPAVRSEPAQPVGEAAPPPEKKPPASQRDPAPGADPAPSSEPLVVRVLHPPAGTELEAARVRVVIDAPAGAEVKVGDVIATADEDGTYSAEVALQLGKNTLQVVATLNGRSGSAEHVLERTADPLEGQ